jgi:hypothetical protein
MKTTDLKVGERYTLWEPHEESTRTALCVEVRECWADGDGVGGQIDELPFIPGDHPFYEIDEKTMKVNMDVRNPLGFFVMEQDWDIIFKPGGTVKAGDVVCTAVADHIRPITDDELVELD